MPWPPQVHDLDETEIKMTDYYICFLINRFLNVLTKVLVG